MKKSSSVRQKILKSKDYRRRSRELLRKNKLSLNLLLTSRYNNMKRD